MRGLRGWLALGAVLKRFLLPDDRVWAGIEKLSFWVLLPALIAARDGELDQVDLRWHAEPAITVVMAARG